VTLRGDIAEGVRYGLLLTTFAVGGLAGTAVAGRLQAWFGATWVLRVGLVVEALTHLTLATTRRPWLAAAILVVFGVHTMVWGVIVTTLRQRAVPGRLLGRVAGVQTLLEAAGATLGLLLGGVLAQGLGVTAPFWIASAAVVVVAAVAWASLGEASGRTTR
jgi:predicted MFS family arabinose efflux permease